MSLTERVEAFSTAADQDIGSKTTLESENAELVDRAEKIEQELSVLAAVTSVLGDTAEEQGDSGTEALNDLVSRGLRQVYEDETEEFDIEIKSLRGHPNAFFFGTQEIGGAKVRAAMKDRGSGVAEIAGLLLQSGVVMADKTAAPILILDNMDRLMGHLPNKKVKAVLEAIKQLSEEQQIIITTTKPDLGKIADVLIRVEPDKDGWVTIKEDENA